MYNVIYLGKFNCINMGFDKTGNKRIEIKKISFRSKSFFGGYSHMCPPHTCLRSYPPLPFKTIWLKWNCTIKAKNKTRPTPLCRYILISVSIWNYLCVFIIELVQLEPILLNEHNARYGVKNGSTEHGLH